MQNVYPVGLTGYQFFVTSYEVYETWKLKLSFGISTEFSVSGDVGSWCTNFRCFKSNVMEYGLVWQGGIGVGCKKLCTKVV